MRRIWLKIIHNPLRTVIISLIYFVLILFLMTTMQFFQANEQLDKLTKDRIKNHFTITSSLNDAASIVYHPEFEKTDQIIQAYQDIYLKIKSLPGVKAILNKAMIDPALQFSKDIDSSENYSYLYFPDLPRNFYIGLSIEDQEIYRMGTISNDIVNNQQYYSLFIDGNIDHAKLMPNIVGVNDSEMFDYRIEQIDIVKGDLFTERAIDEGLFEIIVPQTCFLVNRQEIMLPPEIGETIYLTVKDEEYNKVYEFKVVGIHDGFNNEDIQFGGYNYYLDKNVYIPLKTWEAIKADLDKNNAKPINYVSYPLMFEVTDRTQMQNILNEILPTLKQYNEQYPEMALSYVSSIDAYVDAIGLIESNRLIYGILTITLFIIIMITVLIFNIFNLNNCRQEIGVFDALGENKFKILSNLFIENIIFSLLPMIISFYLSFIYVKDFAAKQFSHQIMEALSGQYNPHYYDNTATGSLTEKFIFQFDLNSYLVVIGCWLLIMIVAFVLVYLKLRKMNTKEFLLMTKGD